MSSHFQFVPLPLSSLAAAVVVSSGAPLSLLPNTWTDDHDGAMYRVFKICLGNIYRKYLNSAMVLLILHEI